MMPLPSFTRHGTAYSPEKDSESCPQPGRSAMKPHRPSTTAIVVAKEDEGAVRKSESIRRPRKEPADGTPRSKRTAPVRKPSPTPPHRVRRSSGSISESRPRTSNGVPTRAAPKPPGPVPFRAPCLQKDRRSVDQPPSYPAPSVNQPPSYPAPNVDQPPNYPAPKVPLGQRNVLDEEPGKRTGKLLQSDLNSPSKPSPLRMQSSSRSTMSRPSCMLACPSSAVSNPSYV